MRKLYLFSNNFINNNRWYHCYAMSDSGHVLASHICSHPYFMEGDLISNRPDRKKKYEDHFGGALGEAFEIVELEVGEIPPEEVLKKNEELGKQADLQETKPGVEITFDDGATIKY